MVETTLSQGEEFPLANRTIRLDRPFMVCCPTRASSRLSRVAHKWF